MTINGTYTLDKNENLDGLLKGIGLSDEIVQRFLAAKPTITLNLTGTTLEIKTKSKEDHTNVLTLGSASKYTLVSGFELEINVTVSGNSAKGTLKKGDKSGEFTIDFNDGGLVETFNIGGIVAKRFYKRA